MKNLLLFLLLFFCLSAFAANDSGQITLVNDTSAQRVVFVCWGWGSANTYTENTYSVSTAIAPGETRSLTFDHWNFGSSDTSDTQQEWAGWNDGSVWKYSPMFTTPQNYTIGGASICTLYLSTMDTNSMPCVTNISWTVTDHSQFGTLYGVVDTTSQGNLGPGTYQYQLGKFLRPGQSQVFTMNSVPCANASHYVLADLGSGTQNQVNLGGTNYYSTSAFNPAQTLPNTPGQIGSTSDQQPSGTIYNANNTTNSPVIWQAAAATNPSVAIQDAGSATVDALTKASTQAHSDAQAIAAAIGSLGGTNGVSNGTGTNIGLTLTNYATETTATNQLAVLCGLTNMLGSALDHNTNIDLSSQVAAGTAAADAGKTPLETLSGNLTPGDRNERYGSPTSTWIVSVGYLGVGSINLDPFSYSWVVALAGFMRNLVTWICGAGLYYRNIKLLINTINTMFTFRQAQTAGTTVLGVNANTLSCIVVAGLITTAMLVVPMYFSDWFGASGLVSMLVTNPFSASGTTGGTILASSVYIVDQFFPLAFMVWCTVSAIAFRAGLAPVLWLVGTVIRFLVGL